MWFSNLFHKKTELEREEELEKEIIDNNLQVRSTTAVVIQYKAADEETEPTVIKICNFHSDILPTNESIIWAPNESKTKLVPYKVIRFDFFEDLDSDTSSKLYIVVKPAYINEVVDFTPF